MRPEHRTVDVTMFTACHIGHLHPGPVIRVDMWWLWRGDIRTVLVPWPSAVAVPCAN